MIYLFLGSDWAVKDRKVEEIKKECFPSPDAATLDYEPLHAVKLDPVVLKKALLALPALAPKRLILIRSAEKLDAHNQDILLEFAQGDHSHAVVILDSQESLSKSGFFSKISPAVRVVKFGADAQSQTVFDMTKAIEKCQASEALNILAGLFDAGDPPVKIIGALVWFWGNARRRLSADRFKKGLLILQEADLNIKRSRLGPECAVEIAVTKLSVLMGLKGL